MSKRRPTPIRYNTTSDSATVNAGAIPYHTGDLAPPTFTPSVPALPATDDEWADAPIVDVLSFEGLQAALADHDGETLDDLDCNNPPASDDSDDGVAPSDEPAGDADGDAAQERFDNARAADPIGVVLPGDRDGLSHLVVRSLTKRDHGVYDGNVVDLVKQRQVDAGLEPTGIVSGLTWALVLRELEPGALGHEVLILRKLLNCDPRGAFDDDVLDAYMALTGLPTVDRDGWWGVIDLALNIFEFPNPQPDTINKEA